MCAILKKPLGEVVPFPDALGRLRGKRVVAVGDRVAYNFLEAGTTPFISVFDFKTLRKPVGRAVEERIRKAYPSMLRVEKPAGELSAEMFGIAGKMLRKGGGLFVEGEEDLFTLPFAMLAREEEVVYGQPGEGCVIVDRNGAWKKETAGIIRKMGLMFRH